MRRRTPTSRPRPRPPSTLLVAAALLAAALGAPCPAAAADDPCQSPSVALVICYQKDGGVGAGTGFMVIDERHLVTNHHVVHGGDQQDEPCQRIEVKFGPERVVAARILTSRKVQDLAVLELQEDGPEPLRLYVGEPDAMKGKPIWVVGFPGVSNEHFDPRQGGPAALEAFVRWRDSNCTPGSIEKKGVDRLGRAVFETSAAIRHGNSGGPVLDPCGNVVGIATYGRELRGDQSRYAVSVKELVDKVLPDVGLVADTVTSPCDPSSSSTLLVLLLAAVGVAGIGTLAWALRRPGPEKSAAHRQREKKGPTPPPNDDDSRRDEPAGPAVTLLGRGGPLQGQSYPLDPGDYGVGRDPAVCAVILPAGTKGVSRHHATLRVRPDGSVLLQDNNSSAGTFVAGRRLPVADWQPLAAGEVFTLGEDDVRFELRRSGGERRGA